MDTGDEEGASSRIIGTLRQYRGQMDDDYVERLGRSTVWRVIMMMDRRGGVTLILVEHPLTFYFFYFAKNRLILLKEAEASYLYAMVFYSGHLYSYSGWGSRRILTRLLTVSMLVRTFLSRSPIMLLRGITPLSLQDE